MLLEDYLSYSHYLNVTQKESLPENLLNEKTVTWNHIDYLQKLSVTRVRDYLLLPSMKKLSLSPDEKRCIANILKVFVDDTHDRISRISKFFVRYSRVYVRYKHIFSAMVGTYAVQPDGNKPRIFMRDLIHDRKTNQIKYSTYVIPSTLEVLNYYEVIKNDLERVFLSPLETHVQSMQNCGRPFLMPDIYCVPENDKSKWLEIVRKINFFTGSIPKMNLCNQHKTNKCTQHVKRVD